MSNTFTVSKDELPSGSYSITLRAPLFKDYRLAKKRYPQPDQQRGQANVPYSFEELMLAMCIEAINGVPLDTIPKDMAERLEPFPIADRQYLMLLFIEMFFVSVDQAQSARDEAEEARKQVKLDYRIDESKIPSGNASIGFKSPNTRVQFEVDRMYKGVQRSGLSLEETLLSYCTTDLDGKPKAENSLETLFDEWEIADVQFVTGLFVNLFTINDENSEKARKQARELKAKLGKSVIAETKAGLDKTATSTKS
jgi:hypothetical protein